MSSSAASSASEVAVCPSGRSTWRQVCDIPVSCQPLAARQDKDLHWPATLVDVSSQGVGLVLSRRFERGVSLAIEVPQHAEQPADTLLARVVCVELLPDGRWRHGCQLMSPLGSEELTALLQRGPQEEKTAEQVLTSVTLEWSPAAPHTPVFHARRVRMHGRWPLPPGAIVRVSPGARPQWWLRVQVQECALEQNGWRLRCAVLGQPPASALAAFGLAPSEPAA
jgi:hypothetical protein